MMSFCLFFSNSHLFHGGTGRTYTQPYRTRKSKIQCHTVSCTQCDRLCLVAFMIMKREDVNGSSRMHGVAKICLVHK